jgi:tetratricopeptide (TPR) repeat protein
MRLLHFDTLGRLILTDFRGKPSPPYAILSHRWSDSETLIEDIPNGNYKEKEEGYRKLKFCAEQAAQDGLQYFWIDTCCIDRWDNNERSKAINSMFQWYQNAARCYVFLSDVSLSAVTETAACSHWEASFRKSEWFARGWTLQELIAPVSVEFFSHEGQRIGDKASLGRLLHEITDIPLAALRNCPLDQFSTSERRRWVENRRTTEDEDIVYCLLGLLGVSMPTTYGEGKESALRRLQAEVEGAGSAPSIIPFSRNQSFVGRELQLVELEAKLFSNEQTTTTLAIVGPGGTGKSQLALEAAYRTKQNNKSCSVFWMDASDIDSLYRSYASVAQKLSIPGCNDDQANIKQTMKRCVAAISARQCLLIYDNVEGTTLRPSGSSTTQAADLADFLPHSKLCSVIFTTTESNTAEALAPQNVTALHELTPDTALRMLQNRLTTPLSIAEQQDTMHLLDELSYLPLAVVQAAACMNASGMTVQQYQAKLDQHKEAALRYSDDSSKGELRESDLRNIVAATLDLSMSQVCQSNAVAADYLFVAACVDRKDISLELLEAASPRAREDAIKVLDRYALVTRRPAESALDVHRLVHQALRKRLQVQGQLMQWAKRTITQLLQVFPNNDHSNRSKWRRLLPHAQHALSHSLADDNDEDKLDLASKCATTLYSDGRYKEAEELQLQVMQTRKRVLGDEHPDTLGSKTNLALTYRNQGRWNEAEELSVQVMQMRKRVLGDEHPDTLTIMANLAATYSNQGRWNEAEELSVQVLQMRKRVLGDEHPDTLGSKANLALTYRNQGRWNETEELEVQVLQTRKRVLGDEHPNTLTSMANLAATYSNQGRWNEAEKLSAQVMQMRKRMLGNEHPDMLLSMANLALTHRDQGRWNKAEELSVQVLQMRKRVLGDEHPDTLGSMTNLAATYSDQGRWNEAEELSVQVMQMRKRVLGDEHPNTLTSMANLAATYSDQGRWNEAEELSVQVLQMRKRVLGDEHPDTLGSKANLALTYSDQGRWNEAEELEVQVLQMRKRVLGNEHPDTLGSMTNLAATYSNQGRWNEAEKLEVQVLQTRKRVLGNEHPNTLTSMANLAATYSDQGRWNKAEELSVQVLQMRKRVLGDEHPDTLGSKANLALTYRNQGRWNETEELSVQVLQMRKRVLGDEHPNTLTSMANLAATYSDQGRWNEAEELSVQVLQMRKRVLGNEHPNTLTSMYNLAFSLRSQARREEALALMETCLLSRQQVLGEQHPDTQLSLGTLSGWRAERSD